MLDSSLPHLSPQELSGSVQEALGLEDYSKKGIEGVQRLTIPNFTGEQGDFSEVIRLNESGEVEAIPGFKLRQINRSHLFPDSIKAWHLHFKQNEIWYVAPHYTLFVGLYDARDNSPTKEQSMRITLGCGKSELLLIPKGVAHGLKTFSHQPINLYYLVDQQFNLEDPDERRLPWDFLGAEFWEFERG